MPLVQVFPQPPQLLLSFCVSMQVPAQQVRFGLQGPPAPQLQEPLLQVVPGGHALSHVPHVCGSVGSLQPSAQHRSWFGQGLSWQQNWSCGMHWSLQQLSPGPQLLAHPPPQVGVVHGPHFFGTQEKPLHCWVSSQQNPPQTSVPEGHGHVALWHLSSQGWKGMVNPRHAAQAAAPGAVRTPGGRQAAVHATFCASQAASQT